MPEKVLKGDQIAAFAKEILDNPVFNLIFDTHTKRLLSDWENTMVEEKDRRERIYLSYTAFNEVKKAIIKLYNLYKNRTEQEELKQSSSKPLSLDQVLHTIIMGENVNA